MTWQEDGACAGMLGGLFDPLEGVGSVWTLRTRARICQAVAVCAGCPVAVQCGSEGVEGRHSGVWGGRVLVEGRVVSPPSLRYLSPCGTETSWARHRRSAEVCARCEAAHADKVAMRRESRRRSDLRRRRDGVA